MWPGRLQSILLGNMLLLVYTYQLCLNSTLGTDTISVQSWSNVEFLSITYLLAPQRRVLLERLTSSQLVKKFPEFYGTRKFITTFTSVRHLNFYRFGCIIFWGLKLYLCDTAAFKWAIVHQSHDRGAGIELLSNGAGRENRSTPKETCASPTFCSKYFTRTAVRFLSWIQSSGTGRTWRWHNPGLRVKWIHFRLLTNLRPRIIQNLVWRNTRLFCAKIIQARKHATSSIRRSKFATSAAAGRN